MKQSDIFSIIIIASVGTMAAYFGLNSILGDPDLQVANVKTINAISSALINPDPELFNNEAINPTVEVFVGECQDIDNNGILSVDELISCGKLTKEQVQSQEALHCADGTEVLDLSVCPENQIVQQEENNTEQQLEQQNTENQNEGQ